MEAAPIQALARWIGERQQQLARDNGRKDAPLSEASIILGTGLIFPIHWERCFFPLTTPGFPALTSCLVTPRALTKNFHKTRQPIIDAATVMLDEDWEEVNLEDKEVILDLVNAPIKEFHRVCAFIRLAFPFCALCE